MGVCLHPKYGGWFAMRCVFVFKNLQVPNEQLAYREPSDPLNGDPERILDLLKKFNYNWRDSTYRDCIRPQERYSNMQLEYFLREPKHRKTLIVDWLAFNSIEKLLKTYREKETKNYLIRNFYIV